MRLFIFVGAVFLLSACSHQNPTLVGTPDLHEPSEIIQILEKSKITYAIEKLDSSGVDSLTARIVLHNQYYLHTDSTGTQLQEYLLSPELLDSLNRAETLFQEKKYQHALKLYRYLYAADPGYHHALTLIGDVFFVQDDLDSAAVYFNKAISKNFIDYNAHWFLADTYWEKGDFELALREITTAHLLNRNHDVLHDRVKYYHSQFGEAYQDWTFTPQYQISQSDAGKVLVQYSGNWLGYALVKALWKYEPGYAESMLGYQPEEGTMTNMEEKEALISFLVLGENDIPLPAIINDGYINEFILYEIMGVKAPGSLLLMPRETQDRIIEYLIKYH